MHFFDMYDHSVGFGVLWLMYNIVPRRTALDHPSGLTPNVSLHPLARFSFSDRAEQTRIIPLMPRLSLSP